MMPRIILENNPQPPLCIHRRESTRRCVIYGAMIWQTPARDAAALAHLTDMDRTPVGSSGMIVMADDGVPEWRMG